MRENRYDEVGKVKDIDIATILDSSNLIKKGKVYDLGMEINENLPVKEQEIFPFRMFFESTPGDTKKYLKTIDNKSRVSVSSEIMISTTHISTHIDALCHFQIDDEVLKKFDVKESRDKKGWKKCGTETIPPIVGRCILLDIAKYLKVEKIESKYTISLNEIKDYIRLKKINIRFGDIVCIRTGKIQDFYNESYLAEGPGIGSEAACWLADQGMCVLCVDYNTVDGYPYSDFNNCTHTKMLCDKGVYLIENIYLEELSKDNIDEFFIICSSPKFTGFSGSWVRPVGIV